MEDQKPFHEALRIFKEVRAALPPDTHASAAERLDEAIRMLEIALDDESAEAVSRHDLLDALSDVLKAFSRFAILVEKTIEIINHL